MSDGVLRLEVTGEVWYWRGPAPFYFITVPDDQSREIRDVASEVTYGWGMIPARLRTGGTEWQTALWAKDDGYVVPMKLAVREAEGIDEGDSVTVQVTVIAPR